jgi:angiopoietin 2
LTAVVPYSLRVDMTDWAGNTAYAEYSSFVVGGATTNYQLSSVGNYSGTAGTDAYVAASL